MTLIGPLKGRHGRCGYQRLFCDSLRCRVCRPKKLRRMRARIAQLAEQLKLKRLATLTLDPARLSDPKHSDRYIRNCWRKMRVKLERKFGASVIFISVLEYQKSGIAHLHVLVGVYIDQRWLSQAWQAVGGGSIVDIRIVDVHRVAGYLASYLAGEKVEKTLRLLPFRARIFSSSRSIKLQEKGKSSGWWPSRRDIGFLFAVCRDPSCERFEATGEGPPLLVFFEGGLSAAARRGVDGFKLVEAFIRARTADGPEPNSA